MKTAFPYFGSKARIAPAIWERFQDPAYYYEPFGGSLATLLARPDGMAIRYENVGDVDCHVVNFFRAAKLASPEEWERLAKWPASQLDLIARNNHLKKQRTRLKQGLATDALWYDLTCASFFCWTQSVRVTTMGKTIVIGRNAGTGRHTVDLVEYFAALKKRLEHVAFWYGNWIQLAKSAVIEAQHRECAILLDPPYQTVGRQKDLYLNDCGTVANHVYRWAVATAPKYPKLKIAICGYAGDQNIIPSTWEELPWVSQLGKGRERVWFSPSCKN